MCDILSKSHSILIKNHKHDSSTILSKDVPDNGLNESLQTSDLKLESERLKTFHNFHNKSNVEDLAKVGFYHINNKAKCAFCSIEVSFSAFGENPLDEHLRVSPSCPFARARKGQRTLTSFLRALPADQDVCGNVDTFTDSVRFLSKVVHPYEDVNSRTKSFDTWPESSKLKAEDLAAAGFYYKGVGDKTVCFQCSGPLNDWEDDDDPWEQHALWYPKCKFVLEEKGQDFVETVQNKFKNVSYDLSANTKESEQSTVDDEKMCLLCCNSQRDVVFVPCGHDWTCLSCMRSLEDKKCPICRELIVQVRNL